MKAQLNITIGQYTTKGQKPINQDYYGYHIPDNYLLNTKGIAVAIADGISSSDVSQEASKTAISSFLGDYYSTAETWSVKQSGLRVLQATNSWLFAQTRNSPHRFNKEKGYICTFSAIVFKSSTAHLFHSGDSRIYRQAGKKLEKLTNDHRHHLSANESYITSALGIHQQLDMDYSSTSVEIGETFLLCTDGVYEFVSEESITDIIAANQDDLNMAAEQIVTQALDAGSDDNLSIQIVRVDSLPSKEASELVQAVSELPLPPALSPRMVFEGYEIIRDIYISSRSHVYLAKDQTSGQHVVIKTPSTEMRNDETYLEQFLLEEWIAKRLDNSHILKAFTPERKRNYLYTVTEYIEGQNLKQWMTDNPKPSVEAVRHIIEQVAKGLQAFHRQEMIHQDLRPNNIMIDQSGTVKIIDFGSTTVAGLSDIKANNDGIQGTLLYTAPEYFIGETPRANSDIFSLGVMAYQMLTGELPYGTDVSKATTKAAQRALNYSPMRQQEYRPVPAWVELAIKQALKVNPNDRYTEVSEFSYDLRHPNPKYQRQSKPPIIERNPTAFWQVMAMILLLLNLIQLIVNTQS